MCQLFFYLINLFIYKYFLGKVQLIHGLRAKIIALLQDKRLASVLHLSGKN